MRVPARRFMLGRQPAYPGTGVEPVALKQLRHKTITPSDKIAGSLLIGHLDERSTPLCG